MVVQQMIPRRDPAATWTANNPVLANGEIGLETDTRREKQGDGVTAWNSLGYRIPASPNWASIPDYAMLAKDPALSTTGWARWITATEQVARALGWAIVTDPQWGAVAGTDCTAAIQKCLDYLDGFDSTTSTYNGNPRGGTIYFPVPRLVNSGYDVSKSVVGSARINWIGGSGASYGGPAAIIRAKIGGNWTNTNAEAGTTGLDPGMPWVVRLSRVEKLAADTEWWHAGSFQGIMIDCNSQYVGGLVGAGAGEISVVDRVQITGTGVQARTVSDAVFNGTSTVTSNSGAFDVLEDMAAKIDSTLLPAWNANVTVNDAVLNVNSAVVTSPGNGFANVQVGMEVVGGNAGLHGTNYVLTKTSSGSITLAYPLLAKDGPGGTGMQVILGRPREFRIEQIIDAHTIKLTRPIPISATGNMTIYRPRPGMRWYGGGATGNIRSLNVSSNSGSGAEWVSGAPNYVMNIAGDNNGGPLIRFHKCSDQGDPITAVISSIKAENNNYGDVTVKQYENYADHDPVILADYCGMIDIEVIGGDVYAGDRGTRDLVRVQQSTNWASGFPSLSLRGLEGVNPWNVNFENIYRDVDSGQTVVSGNPYVPTFGGRYFPDVRVNKDEIRFGDLYLKEVPATPGFGGELDIRGQKVSAGRSSTMEWAWDTPPDAEVLGAWMPVSSAAAFHRYGWAYPNAGNTLNSLEWRWNVQCLPGTTKLWVAYAKRQDFAITTWELSQDNGATWTLLGTLDGYTASGTLDESFQSYVGAGNGITRAGPGILRVRNPTRNAANTTGWYWAIAIVRFWTG